MTFPQRSDNSDSTTDHGGTAAILRAYHAMPMVLQLGSLGASVPGWFLWKGV